MRYAQPDQAPTDHAHEPAHTQSDLVRRLATGACVQEMMRRGEIGEQALALAQMMAGRAAGPAPMGRPAGTN